MQQFLGIPFANLLGFLAWLVPGAHLFWGILFLTILIRLILLPSTFQMLKSQRKMQELQPVLNDLKNQFGDDREGLTKAQLALYNENGVNPVSSSCLPLLIQFPVLIGLYAGIQEIVAKNDVFYSWVPHDEFLNSVIGPIDLRVADTSFILVTIAAALQFLQLWLGISHQKKRATEVSPMEQQMRMMMYIYPLSLFFIGGRIQSGIVLYWIIGTIFSIVQQLYVNRHFYPLAGVEAVKKELASHTKEPGTVKSVEKKAGTTITVRRKK
jgi:YidC/Oxa1 family membrane protein insertase